MKRVRVYVPVVVGILSLVAGGVLGFIGGVASSELVTGLFEMPDIAQPRNLVRERFQLQYPSNWKVDVDDETYDPDHMFRIESPNAAFVMFKLYDGKSNLEDLLQNRISAFDELFDYPTISNFERYGQFSGNGAILRGKSAEEHGGIRITIKVFCFYKDNMTVTIVQYYLDDTLEYVEDGLTLIEDSFSLIASDETNE
jgi:hypothetical protein